MGKFKQGAKPYESDVSEIKVGLPNNNGPIKPIGNIPGHHRIGSYQPVASSNHFQGYEARSPINKPQGKLPASGEQIKISNKSLYKIKMCQRPKTGNGTC